MGYDRYLVLIPFALLTLAIIVLVSCGVNSVRSDNILNSFSKHVNKSSNDLNLTIYYLSPYVFTIYSIDVNGLVERHHRYEIFVDGNDLEMHMGLLGQIVSANLVPVESGSHLEARLYYVFKTNKNRKVLDVAMWGDYNSMFINGYEIKENEVFYDVIRPFLPEEVILDLERYLDGRKGIVNG